MKKAIVLFVLMSSTLGFSVETTEFHWILCESPKTVVDKLNADIVDSKSRQSLYYDTENQSLYRDGSVLRLRLDNRKLGTSTVKVTTEPDDRRILKWRQTGGVKCEWDYRKNKQTYHCSMKRKIPDDRLHRMFYPRQDPTDFFSRQQREFLSDYDVHPDWEQLVSYGPADSGKWEIEAEDSDLEIDLEQFKFKNKSLVEISTRADTNNPGQFYQQFTRSLSSRKIKICPKQVSKTWWVLNSR